MEDRKILRQDDFVSSQLVLVSWRYGCDYGGHLAACLVLSCLCNRVKAGWGSWMEVIENIPKHSATFEIPNKNKFPLIWDQNFIRLLHEVEGIKNGSSIDYAKGGVYFCDLRYVETGFFKKEILGNPEVHPRICDMNSFSVFR